MDEHLLRLEGHPNDVQAIDTLFRSAHSIKGMSITMGFDELSQIAHALESFLDPYRKGMQRLDRQALNLLLQRVDLLRQLIAQVGGDGGGRKESSD